MNALIPPLPPAALMNGSAGGASFAVTFFNSKFGKTKHEQRFTTATLAQRIQAVTASTKDQLGWLKLATFGGVGTAEGCLRNDANVLSVSGIEADYDGEQMTMDEAVEIATLAGVLCIIYTSPSHTDAKPRWRVLCPFTNPLPPTRREEMLGRLNGLYRGIFSTESWTLSQSYYYGSVRGNPAHRVEVLDGEPIDKLDELDGIWLAKPNTETRLGTDGKPRSGPIDEAALLGEITSGNSYHMPVVRLAGTWAFRGVPLLEAQTRLRAAFDGVFPSDRDERWPKRRADIDRCLLDIYAKEGKARDEGKRGYGGDKSAETQRDADPAAEFKDAPRASRMPLLWLDDISPVLTAQDFVQGVLVRGSAAVIYGKSNAGKTFWTTDLALRVAAGMRWNNRRVDRGGVVYCALEGGNGFRNRTAAWKTKYPESKGSPFAAIASSVNLLHPTADVPLLIENVKTAASLSGFAVSLVVIDTLSRALSGGNENAPDDMGALVINMDKIRAETGACVLFVHHCGKDEARGMRGHSLLLGAIDTEIEISVDEETGERVASVVKQRDLPKGQKFGFRLQSVALGQNEYGEDVTTCLVEASEGVPIARPPRAARPTLHDVALAELIRAIMDNGKIPPASENIPPDVHAITTEMWRTYCYGLQKPDATPEAKRQAFSRATKLLIDGGRVQTGDGWMWVIAK